MCGTRAMLDPNGLFGEGDKALLCLNASDWSQAALTWFADSSRRLGRSKRSILTVLSQGNLRTATPETSSSSETDSLE